MLRMIIQRLKGNREVVQVHDFLDSVPEEAFIPVTAEQDLWENLEIIFSGCPITIVAITAGSHVLQLWLVPGRVKLYCYLPDRRINTERLLGKPALGPSPPYRLNYSATPDGSA